MPKTHTLNLEQRVVQLEEQIEQLLDIIDQLKPMAQVYGVYKGHDAREVPCVITNVFPKAGTMEIVVFDNQYSGGKTEITCELGLDRNEARPYWGYPPAKPKVILPPPEVVNLLKAEEADEQLVAS